MQIDLIQTALRAANLDGWLFFDHHRRDPLAYRILGLPEDLQPTRRWYYYLPANGEPRKLVHRIESGSLDSVPGTKTAYSSWADQQQKLNTLLGGAKRIAMQYSPNCAIPYVSMIDAGTIELVRATGVEIVTSADLVQEFEARWTEQQFQLHLQAGMLVDKVLREAFDLVREKLQCKQALTEYEVQQFIRRKFTQNDLYCDHGPIVAVNANASDPHYEPTQERTSHIQIADVLLIDLWAKLTQPDAVYYDITWTGFCGDVIPETVRNVFEVVRDARKRGSQFVIDRVAQKSSIAGFEVDDAVRGVIEKAGYGSYFFHRTGHSIGSEVHGTGANMDNLESHDERRIIADSCFSIEPGIYLPEFGIRSEVNVYVGEGFARVTGEQQEQMVHLS
jgi:Xaa-Pro aminopeptidase